MLPRSRELTRLPLYCVGILTPRLFGRRYIGGIPGVTTAINVVGSACDLFGGYTEVPVISAAVLCSCCVTRRSFCR